MAKPRLSNLMSSPHSFSINSGYYTHYSVKPLSCVATQQLNGGALIGYHFTDHFNLSSV